MTDINFGNVELSDHFQWVTRSLTASSNWDNSNLRSSHFIGHSQQSIIQVLMQSLKHGVLVLKSIVLVVFRDDL